MEIDDIEETKEKSDNSTNTEMDKLSPDVRLFHCFNRRQIFDSFFTDKKQKIDDFELVIIKTYKKEGYTDKLEQDLFEEAKEEFIGSINDAIEDYKENDYISFSRRGRKHINSLQERKKKVEDISKDDLAIYVPYLRVKVNNEWFVLQVGEPQSSQEQVYENISELKRNLDNDNSTEFINDGEIITYQPLIDILRSKVTSITLFTLLSSLVLIMSPALALIFVVGVIQFYFLNVLDIYTGNKNSFSFLPEEEMTYDAYENKNEQYTVTEKFNHEQEDYNIVHLEFNENDDIVITPEEITDVTWTIDTRGGVLEQRLPEVFDHPINEVESVQIKENKPWNSGLVSDCGKYVIQGK